ncbi:MAG: cbb3-type cytochrome c oxidase subunit I, partial [Verrucomicrobia bacterium]|nr:cbb3-type cytochrome c oxidase subunit I [Verrucomicrobiota bacterium]
AVMIRAQQIFSVGDATGFLSVSHFQQVFSAHGATMIFFVGMGVVFALFNLIIPLQIGARDVAFPFLNAISFWLFLVGAILINISLVVGNFSAAGWLAYPPLSGLEYSPDVGVDYWIWTVQIAGIGSLLSGINFLITIFKMRCPGMTFMKMPLFIWTALASIFLIIFAFPILTATLGMLSLDRLLGMHFFTSSFGGNPMMYINLIWAWGHPEVYILILPAFGVFSEIVATYSQKRLFGYVSMVWATVVIAFLSFIVWVHHFFTMGAGANVNAFFGIMTMLIAVPTGVKIFNWLFTMYRGKVRFDTPILWFIGFVIAFTIGGMTGMLLSIPPVDFQIHNSLFLIAHFHSMILPGVVFGFFAAFAYWFPKFTGFKLNETLGRCACWCWIIGFMLAFMPLYTLGLMGATRRLDHYDESTGWRPLFILSGFGIILIIIGAGFQTLQIFLSILQRKKHKDLTGDPWNGRTLEWSLPSPPPIYNFAHLPVVRNIDAFFEEKQNKPIDKGPYEDILIPRNTPLGMFIGVCSLFFGFAIVWHITWLCLLSILGIFVCMIIRLADKDPEELLSASEVDSLEKRYRGEYS